MYNKALGYVAFRCMDLADTWILIGPENNRDKQILTKSLANK